MNLAKFLENNEVDEELIYVRGGLVCKAYPLVDCSLIDIVDEVEELHKVSASYYFYGQISCEIIEAKEKLELNLISQKEVLSEALLIRKSNVYLIQQVKLQQTKSRCTERLLESLVNSDEEVISLTKQLTNLSNIKEKIIELRSAENKIKIILKAILLKQDDLIEISRRKKEELKIINHLS